MNLMKKLPKKYSLKKGIFALAMGITLTGCAKSEVKEEYPVIDEIVEETIQEKLVTQAEVKVDCQEQFEERRMKVIITSDKCMKPILGWELSENKLVMTKTFENSISDYNKTLYFEETENEIVESYNIVLSFIIDKSIGNVEVLYDEENLTNKDVLVKIQAEEIIKEVDGWELSENKKFLSKLYKENTPMPDKVIIENNFGYTKEVEVNVNNIDKTAPIVEVIPVPLSDQNIVRVSLSCNEKVSNLEGWTRSEDKKILTKDFSENTDITVNVSDFVGNITPVQIIINSLVNNANLESKKETTISQPINQSQNNSSNSGSNNNSGSNSNNNQNPGNPGNPSNPGNPDPGNPGNPDPGNPGNPDPGNPGNPGNPDPGNPGNPGNPDPGNPGNPGNPDPTPEPPENSGQPGKVDEDGNNDSNDYDVKIKEWIRLKNDILMAFYDESVTIYVPTDNYIKVKSA